MAAVPLAQQLSIGPSESLHQVRVKLRSAAIGDWTAALGDRGASYQRVWSIIEGEA